jgi:phosphinothricin acetyltransferase
MEIRLGTTADASELYEIYGPYVEETAISFETVVPSAHEMAERIEHTMQSYPWLVAQDGGQLLGYAYAHAFAQRFAYRFSAETSIYLRSSARGQGVGKRLYTALFNILDAQGYREAFAGIAQPNPSSVALHESMGFERVARFKRVGWKLEKWHDVEWWQRAIGDASDVAPLEPKRIDELDPQVVFELLAVT